MAPHGADLSKACPARTANHMRPSRLLCGSQSAFCLGGVCELALASLAEAKGAYCFGSGGYSPVDFNEAIDQPRCADLSQSDHVESNSPPFAVPNFSLSTAFIYTFWC